jgi:hypothetical protein
MISADLRLCNHQFQQPSVIIEAGSNSIRPTVASTTVTTSIPMPMARPTANSVRLNAKNDDLHHHRTAHHDRFGSGDGIERRFAISVSQAV